LPHLGAVVLVAGEDIGGIVDYDQSWLEVAYGLDQPLVGAIKPLLFGAASTASLPASESRCMLLPRMSCISVATCWN
jgi:hypothetical protein